ncbi:uncharacterized protein At2g33490-like isoform X2 [Salvia miltiorrhiza]|uniref:uncharacterized protein At2g33490-like isoform X2 n=1 Tax=Salvia miltiorrhiza TaxID=226208 RepID=UPI0025ACDF27|nr:uncharacterized protein At2g33490-like isoform X2 [Salvia miltiorrhiza]XP_057800479.1 uncharacterized protein At2g33490-like isoform X2 [Salvia miltiorrhiza]
MKSSLLRMRIIGPNKGDPKGKWDHNFSLPIDGLTQATKDMKDMRTCYDSLLSAAAATANSAYEFSESLLEMGNSLLEKTTMHDDRESRGALSMLGKVQLELQKLVDSYRFHIVMTITNPSECLLSELRKVEEMKLQCDEKREMFEYIVAQIKEKGKSRHGKGETFSLQQLKVVRDEYEEAARLCAFRVESLKQGQSRSLFTQAARHHAAQLNFFRKGLQSLEAVEPYIKNVAEKQHIDYELSELNEGEKDDREIISESNDYGELSFDYRQKEQGLGSAYTLRNSMELDQLGAPSAHTSWVKDVELQRSGSRNQWDQIPSQRPRAGSHSAPIYPEKFDAAERVREIRHALPKLTTYVLPTPADAKGSNTTTSGPLSSPKLPAGTSKNLWHSSPLDMEKPKKFTDDQLSAHYILKPQIVVEESSTYKHSLPLPPLTEEAAIPQVDTQSGFDAQKNLRQAFSGPIASKPSLNMTHIPISSNDTPQSVSGLISRASGPQSSLLVNVSHNASPALATSPTPSELHELPRPPDTFGSKPMRSIGTLGHSAPLVSPTNKNPFRQLREGSALPLPQLTVSRSFSIPSSGQREAAFHSGKLLGSPRSSGVASPPLTPISLLHMKSPNSGQIRVNAGGS